MAAGRAYITRSRSSRSAATRARIVSAVRELLEEGSFHESTVEAVAERAGVSRATLYQHFGSRLDLVDGICDELAMNPALVALREVVASDDPDEALEATIANAMDFWASEHAVLRQLYGAAAVDPAARDFVDRQRDDRRGEMERLAHRLRQAGRLRRGVGERRALVLLMLLTSFETFQELRREGLSEGEATRTLQQAGRSELLA